MLFLVPGALEVIHQLGIQQQVAVVVLQLVLQAAGRLMVENLLFGEGQFSVNIFQNFLVGKLKLHPLRLYRLLDELPCNERLQNLNELILLPVRQLQQQIEGCPVEEDGQQVQNIPALRRQQHHSGVDAVPDIGGNVRHRAIVPDAVGRFNDKKRVAIRLPVKALLHLPGRESVRQQALGQLDGLLKGESLQREFFQQTGQGHVL